MKIVPAIIFEIVREIIPIRNNPQTIRQFFLENVKNDEKIPKRKIIETHLEII